ncbi:MAG: zf-HC2 domain-containing protein [Ignavibacteria bacterium]|nr:zf-HC2 domain-containing protein [Ignavibacteria bacterium]
MPNNEKLICQIFETEMWLYLDRNLSDEKMEFWRSHLRACKSCKELLAQSEELISYATESLVIEIDNVFFDEAVLKAVKSKRPGIIKLFLQKRKEMIVPIGKVVLASALVIAAVLISLLSDKPNSVKSVGKEILEWEGEKIKAEIENISYSINMLDQNDWNRQMHFIDQKIELIEKSTDKLSFN